MEFAPAVAICQFFSALYTTQQLILVHVSGGAAIGCATYGRFSVAQWHSRSQGLLGVGLSWWTENKTVLCFNLQDWSRRPCLLFTAKCFSMLRVKTQQKNHNFLLSPHIICLLCVVLHKLIWLELFLPMTMALLSRITCRSNPPFADWFLVFYFNVMVSSWITRGMNTSTCVCPDAVTAGLEAVVWLPERWKTESSTVSQNRKRIFGVKNSKKKTNPKIPKPEKPLQTNKQNNSVKKAIGHPKMHG